MYTTPPCCDNLCRHGYEANVYGDHFECSRWLQCVFLSRRTQRPTEISTIWSTKDLYFYNLTILERYKASFFSRDYILLVKIHVNWSSAYGMIERTTTAANTTILLWKTTFSRQDAELWRSKEFITWSAFTESSKAFDFVWK